VETKVMAARLVSPIEDGILKRRYNKTLHGRSVHRKKDVPGHNVVLGYSRPGVGDALDVFVPAGEPVFAMHSGRISRIADRGGRLSCVYIAGSGFTTVYAHMHIHEILTLGMKVNQGEVIGWVDRKLSDPHLHLEVWAGGRSISAPTPASLAQQIAALCIE
jgi:murein DD-endopeptidase MepM/ murein hydrolase activator NlpD